MEERNRRRTTSVRQIEILIAFMEGHRDLALGRVRSKEARVLSGRLWDQVSELLNAEGAYRTSKEWAKFWNDYKCRVRNKTLEIQKELRSTGGGPSHALQLTPLEDRVASLIGRDVGPLTGVRINPVVNIGDYEEVEMQHENLIIMPTDNSPTLDLSNIHQSIINNSQNIILANQADTAPQAAETEPTMTATEPAEPISGQTNTLPQQTHRNRERRRVMRPHACASSIVHQNTYNQASLNEARATIARIEELRARTEDSTATANLQQAEAAVKLAEAMTSIAQSLQSIAESMRSRSQ